MRPEDRQSEFQAVVAINVALPMVLAPMLALVPVDGRLLVFALMSLALAAANLHRIVRGTGFRRLYWVFMIGNLLAQGGLGSLSLVRLLPTAYALARSLYDLGWAKFASLI